MKSCSISTSIIIFFLGSLTVNSFGELVMIHQKPQEEGDSYKITCMTEDHRAALVWNDDLRNPVLREDTAPIRSKITQECAFAELDNCIADWKKTDDWEVVNSNTRPMAPVFDSRWEEFYQYSLSPNNIKSTYQYVRQVLPSSAVVFSARGLADINIQLCEYPPWKITRRNLCFWITIAGGQNNMSEIRFCFKTHRLCHYEKNITLNESAIKASEWRTFILKWDATRGKIKCYGDNGFSLKEEFPIWINIKHLYVQSSDAGYVRFHFYEYLLIQQNSTKLSSSEFKSGPNFCIESLVNLCAKCELEVRIVDSNNVEQKSERISGSQRNTPGKLLPWQVVKIDAKDLRYSTYTVQIYTILKQSGIQGWWGIDIFRKCKSVDTVKMSTKTFTRSRALASSNSLPIIRCQQLSYNQNSVVSSNISITQRISNSLQNRNNSSTCVFDCTNRYAGISICDQSNCFCPLDLKGSDCNTEHIDGQHECNCQQICGSCKFGMCDITTGFCTLNCEEYYLPPYCKTKLEAPVLDKFNATTASLRYPKLEAANAVQIIYFQKQRKMITQLIANIISNNSDTSLYEIDSLSPNTIYMVQAVVKTTQGIEVKSPKTSFTTSRQVVATDSPDNAGADIVPSPNHQTDKKLENQNLICLVILLILLICCLLLFIWRRKLLNTLRRVRRQNMVPQILMNFVKSTTTCTSQQPPPSPIPTEAEPSRIINMHGTVACNRYSHSISIEDFEDYVKESMSNGLLRSQFLMLRKGVNRSCKYGSLPENKPKNRYVNIIAYDNTRVILNKNPDDLYSDYVNANYVQGYHKRKAYIAAQGPKPLTLVDFWRMIWQEETMIICMLANVVEGYKIKCEQYWPEIGDSKTYGDIVIVTEKEDVLADYTYRAFQVSCKEESRKIEHLHYTGWPDHTVPMYVNSVVAYLKKLQAMPVGRGPIVVHCSAGVGRTGTVILCDICLRRAARKGTLDVLAEFKKLRDSRLNMVDNELQYLFAHLVLTRYLLSPQTELPCNNDLPQAIEELKQKLPKHMKRLHETAWQDEALHPQISTSPPLPEQLAKNRFPKLAPARSDLVYLKRYPTSDDNSDYISAVIVDGAKMKKQYIASQLPLPSTLSDFWRLIAEQRIKLVIILQQPDSNDPTCCDIIPGEKPLNPVPFINVELKICTHSDKSTNIHELLLTDTSGITARTQRVTFLTCSEWGLGKSGKPPPPKKLVELWVSSEAIHRKGPTLVLCHDGITGCGLYMALSFLLERMSMEQKCDIIFAIQAIRRSRPEFLQSQKQFEYLYDAAVKYLESFKTNAKITQIVKDIV